jgi:hypothetical protein
LIFPEKTKPGQNRIISGVFTMGMGIYAQYADTIEEQLVQELCPQEFNAFQEYLKEHDGDMTCRGPVLDPRGLGRNPLGFVGVGI